MSFKACHTPSGVSPISGIRSWLNWDRHSGQDCLVALALSVQTLMVQLVFRSVSACWHPEGVYGVPSRYLALAGVPVIAILFRNSNMPF